MRKTGLLAFLAVAVLVSNPGMAGTERRWSPDTAEEFARGTLDGTMVTVDEGVRLAPQARTVWGPEVGLVWAVLGDGKEGVFLALSDPARLLRIGEGEAPAVWFEGGGEELVTALSTDRSGKVVFGLSPAGRVMRAEGGGEVETLVETGAEHVWALASGTDGKLWVGTGSPGKLMVADRDFDVVRTVHESGDDPVRSIVAMPDGGVVAGTGRRGLVVRVGPSGGKQVLFDAAEEEIVALARAVDGSVWALAAMGREKTPPKPAGNGDRGKGNSDPDSKSVTATVRVRATGNGSVTESSKPRRKAGRTAGGTLYRIEPGGGVISVWRSRSDFPHDMILDGEGRPVVATAREGRLIRIEPDSGDQSVLLSIPSEKATALASGSGQTIFVGGSDDARLVIVGPELNGEGEYLGESVDAGWVADWGAFEWTGARPEGSKLSFLVRSGNTDEPDGTWSDWVSLESVAPGVPVKTGVPAARYFQALVVLGISPAGDSPVVNSLGVTYLAGNRPPRIEKLEVEEAGVVWRRGPSSAPARFGLLLADDPVARRVNDGLNRPAGPGGPIRKAYEPGARTFNWSAKDPDGDELVFSLEISREDEEVWHPLAHDLRDDFLGWDGRGIPDGRYRVRLTVDDLPGNADGENLTDRKISEIFIMDGSRPVLDHLEVTVEGDEYLVEVRAVDRGGVIAALQYALDGGEWRRLSPRDGVCDSEAEAFRLVVARDARSRVGRSLAIRVTDHAGNVVGDLFMLDD